MNTDSSNNTKRGRPSVDVSWPEAPFTAQEIHDSLDKKISRVSVHAKINRAVDHGELEVCGRVKPKTGRPSVVYRKP
tara:strand:+ start:44338 stop:44568 length:231 start_codon:yes stop_codon:yes gene_type:complete